MWRRRSSGTTGIVIKNDVHARGCPISREGVITKHKCHVCHETFLDTEDVIYAFSQRGTQSAASNYFHPRCVFACRQPTSSHAYCRVCEAEEPNIRFNLGYQRGIWVHEGCIKDAPQETVPVETIPERVKKRTEGRLNRAEIRYGLVIEDDGSLRLDRDEISPASKVRVSVRAYDGKLRQVYDTTSPGIPIFERGHWVKRETLYKRQAEDKKSTWRKEASDEAIERALKLQKELQKFYDRKGYPIKERLDADFKLRFLLKHGNSIEGLVHESIQEE